MTNKKHLHTRILQPCLLAQVRPLFRGILNQRRAQKGYGARHVLLLIGISVGKGLAR